MSHNELYDRLLGGVERTRSRFGEFVNFLGVDLQGPTGPSSDIYLARVHFRCEIQQIITEDAIHLADFDLLEKIGSLMAEQLLRSIRKVVFATDVGSLGPVIGNIETRLDSDIPEGIVLMHPKTLYELLRSEE